MHLNRGTDYGMAELVCSFEVRMHNNGSLKTTEGNKGNEEAMPCGQVTEERQIDKQRSVERRKGTPATGAFVCFVLFRSFIALLTVSRKM
jgi:hypothetical protein